MKKKIVFFIIRCNYF